MSDNHKAHHIHGNEHAEGYEMLEQEAAETAPRRRAQASDELPETIYRLKTLHSNETSYGYYASSGGDWPHFRTASELEALLEGPFAPEAPAAPDRTEPAPAEPDQTLTDHGEASGAAVVADTSASAVEVEAAEASDASEEAIHVEAAGTPPTEPGNAEGQPQEEASGLAEEKPARPVHLIPPRALVVAPTKYGKDVVEVQGRAIDTTYVNPDELVLIERPAGIDDLRKIKDNKDKEKHAYEHCRDKIWARNLPMKLVSAHYLLDEPKILFYFTAESRVDFRELVKDLVSLFKMRIELRQIGVRDEARVTGGCGVCGRVLCCHGISDRLNPVSIKMAKDQNLSLNSLKISGPCGRLLCCLSYEYQFYRDARRELPQEGVKFMYDGVLFKVVEVNALSSTVKMAGEDGRVLDMKAERFKYSEGRWKVIEEQAE